MIHVLGLGNVLMGDDGLGPAAVRAFEAQYTAGPDVQICDLGTPGLDLMPWLADADAVVIVDTVKSDLPAGTLVCYDRADLLRYPPSPRIGPHDPGVKEAFLALEFAGREPREFALVGVVPSRTGIDLELSPAVRAAVPRAVEAVRAALERFGALVTPRERVLPAPAWWNGPRTPSVS